MTDDLTPLPAEADASAPVSVAAEPAVLSQLVPPRSGRPRVWTVFVVFLLAQLSDFALVLVILSASLAVMEAFQPAGRTMDEFVEQVESNVTFNVVAIIATMSVFAVAAIVPATMSTEPWRRRLSLRPSGLSLASLIVAFVGVVAIAFCFLAAEGLGWVGESDVFKGLDELVRNASWPELAALVIAIGILPGICEELLFRGYIQTRLCRRWGSVAGIVITSLMFGVMHMDVVQGIFAFFMGLYLGYLTWQTGSIYPAILCHAGNNCLSTLASRRDAEPLTEDAGLGTLLIGAAVVALCVVALHGPRPSDDRGDGL
jgi:uncharacterized protein